MHNAEIVEITTQHLGVFLDLLVSDKSDAKVPARVLIDTGSEGTFLNPEFAKYHFNITGIEASASGMQTVHVGTLYFGRMGEMPAPNIEFRVRQDIPNHFIARQDQNGELKPVNIDVIAGIDALQSLDLAYFHRISSSGTRTFISLWNAGEFIEWSGLQIP
jgi:hypothetical protein